MTFNEIIINNPEAIDYDNPDWIPSLFRILEEGYIYLDVAPEDFVFIRLPISEYYGGYYET